MGMDEHVDYRALYFDLFRAAEKAIRAIDAGAPEQARQLLIRAQQEAEERCLRAGET